MFKEKYGPWALVVGGSDGIGAALAAETCARGINVFLLARRPETLEQHARELRGNYPDVTVQTMSVDLGKDEALERVIAATKDLEIGLFIYNVGSEPQYGNFLDHDSDFIHSRMNRNFVIKTELLHHYAGKMRDRRRGGILIMGSISGFFGSPGFSLYAASKAFTRYLVEGLWYELKEYNIDCLCPIVGVTNTPTMTNAYGPLSEEEAANPADVAKTALDMLPEGPLWVHDDIAEQIEGFLTMNPRERAVMAAEMARKFTGVE